MTRSGNAYSKPQYDVLAPPIQAMASSSNTCVTPYDGCLWLALHGTFAQAFICALNMRSYRLLKMACIKLFTHYCRAMRLKIEV